MYIATLINPKPMSRRSGGAFCMIFGQVGQSDGNVDNLEVVGPDSDAAEAMTHCTWTWMAVYYVCLSVCPSACLYVCMHACMYLRMYVCMYLCM